MPAKVSKSPLMAKLGNKLAESFDKHKDDETRYGGGSDLPKGIEGGIAQLVDCKFDTYKTGDNKGEFFFYAAGIVKAPKEVGGVPIVGLRTQIGPEPLCDTPDRSRKTNRRSLVVGNERTAEARHQNEGDQPRRSRSSGGGSEGVQAALPLPHLGWRQARDCQGWR